VDIEGQSLTLCEIEPDGSAIMLGLIDRDGVPRRVRLPVDQVGALAMTLPSIIEKALQRRYRDESLRYAIRWNPGRSNRLPIRRRVW
jgi:hypothetical protein